MAFELHPQLAEDTLHVTDWPLCRVLLMNDSTYPWLVLVPRRPDKRELHDLAASDRIALVEEAARATRALQQMTGCLKTNAAALGNQVPQFHLHVIARFEDDPAWPGPVWGVVPAQPYEAAAADAMLGRLRDALGDGLGSGGS